MKIGIYSLNKTLFEGGAESINCKTAAGEVTLLNFHRPLVTMLTAGTITLIDNNNKSHYIPISSGFAEVDSANRVKMIVEE